MVAFSFEEQEDTPPADRPRRRRRTKEELEAAGITPKGRTERRSRYAEIFGIFGSINEFIRNSPAARYALTYWDRAEAARQNQCDVSQIPFSELERLTQAFDNYQAADPRLHKWVEKALVSSPGVAFAIVCFSIAYPRLDMMGLIPWNQKPKPQPEPEFEPTTVQSNNGTTPFGENSPVGAPSYE